MSTVPTNLPTDINSGDSGHIEWHETVHGYTNSVTRGFTNLRVKESPYVDPKHPDFGALGGGANDTVAIQAAIDFAAPRGSGSVQTGRTVLLHDSHVITGLILNQQAVTIAGMGPKAQLKWGGAAGGKMIQVLDSSRITVHDLTMLGDPTNPPSSAIYFETPTTPAVGTNEFLCVERVMFGRRYTTEAANSWPMAYAVRMGGAAIGNNDTAYLNQLQIFDATTAGIAIDNEQNRWNTIRDIVFNGCATGLYCRGNTTAINLSFNRSTVVDVDVDDASLDIFGINSEHAAKIWEQGLGSSLTVHGGSINLQAEIGDPWATSRVSAYQRLALFGLNVLDQFAANPKLAINGSSSNTDPAYVLIRGCRLPNGDNDNGYDIDGFATGTPLHIDIQQGTYWRRQVVQALNATGYYMPQASRAVIGSWYQDNVAASQTDVALALAGQPTHNKIIVTRAGSITGVALRSNAARTNGTATVEVTKNGVGTVLTATLDGTNTTFHTSTQNPGMDTFVAGDQIGVRITTDGSWTPTTADMIATVEVVM